MAKSRDFIIISFVFGLCQCIPTVPVPTDSLMEIVVDTTDGSDMKIKQAYLEKEIQELRREVYELKEFVHSQTDTGKSDTQETTGQTTHRIKKRAIRGRFLRQPEIAFQAVLMHHHEVYRMKESIKFDHVITNYAHAYNKENGVFTAPVSGTYFFSTTIVAAKDNYVEASIQVNDEPKVTAVSDHRTTEDYRGWDQGSAVSVLKLKRGDQVTVSILWPHGTHELSGMGKSSFCGYLLRSHERIRLL